MNISNTIVALAFAAIWLCAASATAQTKSDPTQVVHEPISQARGGKAVLRFAVQHPQELGKLLVHVKPNDGAPRTVEARFDGEHYVVSLGADLVARPGFGYWVERKANGESNAVFASAASPHFVSVPDSALEEYEREALTYNGGNRSTLRLDGAYVGFATNEDDGRLHYAHGELGFRYAFFTWVDDIEFRVGTMRSNIPNLSVRDDESDEPKKHGMDYGGASTTLRVHEYFRVRAGLLFGFSEEGFEYGASGEMVLGEPHRTTLRIGVEGVRSLGLTARAKLAWNTVPSLPMAATIEITNFPTGGDPGVLLRYDIGYRFSPAFLMRLGLGYRGQHAQEGGLVGALGAEVSF